MTKTNSGSFKTKQIPFTQVPNIIILDRNVSLAAKGLYSEIQYHVTIPGFILYKSYLMKLASDGKSAFNSRWNELKKAGYLKQYKYRNKEDSGFTYEYELLDVPVIDNDDDNQPDPDDNIVEPENQGVDLEPENLVLENLALENQYVYNNTISNYTDVNNTILSYRSDVPEKTKNDKIRKDTISEEEQQINIETLTDNIEPEIIKQKYPDKKDVIDEIFNIMCDTVNSNKEYITISGDRKPIIVIKNCLFKLDSGHFEYILECLEKVTTDIKNPRAYILATIYNSYHTYNNAVNFNFNRDFKDTMYVGDWLDK